MIGRIDKDYRGRYGVVDACGSWQYGQAGDTLRLWKAAPPSYPVPYVAYDMVLTEEAMREHLGDAGEIIHRDDDEDQDE